MLKKRLAIPCLILFAVSFLCLSAYATGLTINAPIPDGGVAQAVIREINDAKTEILAQALSFTSAPIVKALVDAHKRGVKVEAILDKSDPKDACTSATFLANAKAATYIDTNHSIAHNRMMIIDKTTVITGSFNFTGKGQENNKYNLQIIRSKDLAKPYLDNWSAHREHSEDYEGKLASQRTTALKKP